MRIIALLGRSRVGKDTAAMILSKAFGFHILRLSSPIKDACSVLYDIPREHLDSAHKELVDPRYGRTPRDLMVQMTAVVRECMPSDFFVTRLMSRARSPGIIIPDVRYQEDVDVLKTHDTLRPLILKITRANAPVLHAHEDPIDSMGADVVFKNDDDLCIFEKRVWCFAEHIKVSGWK